MLDLIAICLALTALLAYVNQRVFRLPTTIGVMAIALVLSLVIVGLDAVGLDHGFREREASFIQSIDFSELLMQGMLSLLLFAGALHVDLKALKAHRWQVGALALVGTLATTVLVGGATWLALPWVGIEMPLIHCMLFGALIAPTDPIAVMGIIKSAGAPRELEVVIAGESLFNDGVGIVVFALLAGVLASGSTPSGGDAAMLLLREAGGGIGLGLVIGLVLLVLLRSIDQYQVEVLLTLAAVIGGYALARHLHVSGPLAMVVCGLMVGSSAREHAMSSTTERYIDMFWELIDEILNAVLFVLIGLEVVLVQFSSSLLVGGAVAIAITLLARGLTVALPVRVLRRWFGLPRGASAVLAWGGLRGGISVALALHLPESQYRETILALTYCVVVFSVLVQGLTIGSVVRAAVGGTSRRGTASM
ncbi:sodium:proton antiporter [Variovorax dokdonensis]|uniref:Sodium:proton antiporter n=1 Tax=Variovorax dokdonensis TaxID=344883 RepID=A0ABT7N9A2_9BURK|nr:sodium:proton antiporter [Variovorax dokdonensis]MDM0044513.1 sodium:proton antiporter [Variovorax dokdonensis]